MLPYRDSRLTQIALGLFFLLLIGYGYFEAQGLLFGPSITVTSNVTEVHDPFVLIKGHADRISSLLMNGKSIQVTEKGDFSEPYVLAPGYNRIMLDARDKYGRRSSRTMEIVFTGDSASSMQATNAQKTAATSSFGVAPTKAIAPRQ